MRSPDATGDAWVLTTALVVFVAYALNFLFFFVDDEGITFVYAQHLLAGKGLSYNSIEGPVEGYSNFLDVLTSAGLLAVVHAIHAPKIWVFLLGKMISLAAGAGTVGLTFLTLRQLPEVTTTGRAAGMALVATAGPLALWSCSSMDTVPFTLLVMATLFALVRGDRTAGRRWDWITAAAAVAVLLERLDGAIFVLMLLGGWCVIALPARRRALLRRVILPVVAAAAVYHLGRLWYFGDLLSTPIYAKVLYKLFPAANAVVKAPALPYWREFLQWYGTLPVAGLIAAAGVAAIRRPDVRPVLLVTLTSAAYVARVGDWMFGLRFFVPLLPMLAILLAQVISRFGARRPTLAAAAALAVVVWTADRAVAFERLYETVERKPSWLHQPSFDVGDYFGPFHRLLTDASRVIPPGTRTAYNQAGFLPFMLDLDNIDDLGICSRFYAKLPTRDVFFTEVGRYAPFTSRPVVQAPEAYLLYHEVPFIIQRNDLLRSANAGEIPRTLVDDYYTLVEILDEDSIYRRTGRDASQFRRDPGRFTENLVHVTRLRRVEIDGVALDARAYLPRLPFFRQAGGDIEFSGRYRLDVEFADEDLPIAGLAINGVRTTDATALTVEILSRANDVRARHTVQLGARTPAQLVMPVDVRGSRFRLTLSGPTGRTHAWIDDVRVLGQSPELARFIRETLTFPPVRD